MSLSLNTVFFDLETQYLADEVGGWHHIRDMKLSVGVTYSTANEVFRRYTEETVSDLIAELRAADLVVGFNLLRFDYEVLRAYTDDPLQDIPTVDMLQDLYRTLGFRVSLDAVASATLGATKSADGIKAVEWFRRGEIDKVMAYCERDVEVTRQVYEFGQKNRYVNYRDRYYRVKRVPVVW